MQKLPWVHPLAKAINHLPTVRQTFDEAAKRVRNRLRKYRADSVLQCAVNRLHQARRLERLDELKTWPWLSLLLVKLTLEDTSIKLDKGEVCTPAVFEYCLGVLWNAQGSRERMDESVGRLHLMIRSVIQPQLLFQMRPTVDFLRWPSLIARLPADHPCRKLFLDRFGIEPSTFNLICYATHVPVLNDERLIGPDYFAPIRAALGASVDRFLDEFARDTGSLRTELHAERLVVLANRPRVRPHHELNEVPWLTKYPLLRIGRDDLIVWHPAVFSRGMDQGVHWRLSERGGEYSSEFGRVFEAYVVQLLDEAGLEYLSEADYQLALGTDKNAMEAIITRDGVNVFVEAKLTVYSPDMAQHTQAPVVWKTLKRVRDAMNQAWKVSARLREPGLPDWECAKPVEDILVVVTSQPAFCVTGEHFRRLFKRDIFDPEKLTERKQSTPSAAQLRTLPLENIVIASILEWEHLMGCVGRGEIDLVPFLREVAAANKDPITSVMLLDQLIEKQTKKWEMPSLLKEAQQVTELELVRILGGTEADLEG